MAAIGWKGIKWLSSRSAWQEMEYHRAKRAEFAQSDQSSMDSMNNAMTTALQSKISGSATLAGNAALKRVQAAAKAKQAEAQKQLEETTKKLDAAQKTADAAGVLDTTVDGTTSDPNGTVVDTTA